jgi:hypothetical protein
MFDRERLEGARKFEGRTREPAPRAMPTRRRNCAAGRRDAAGAPSRASSDGRADRIGGVRPLTELAEDFRPERQAKSFAPRPAVALVELPELGRSGGRARL